MSLCFIWALVALLPGGNTGSFRAIARYGQYALLAPAMCSGCGPCAHTPTLRRLCARAVALARIRRLFALLPGGNTGSFRAIARYGQYALLAPAMCSGCGPCAHTPTQRRLCARAGALARIRRLFRPPAGRALVLAHSKEKFFIFYRVQSRVKLYMHAVGA